jgi:hypothetical protein
MEAGMTNKPDDGGPAFPVTPPVDETGRTAVGYPYPDTGMSLRDWFAGQALVSLPVRGGIVTPIDVAADAYRIADAMLVERNREKDK